MPRQTSKGKCNLCGETFSKQAMTRHLAACQPKHIEKSKSKRAPERILHLLVEGQYLPYYWMRIEIPAAATLARLDDFLRRTWLECCGHLSAFEIAGQRYSVAPDDEFLFADDLKEKGFRVALGRILEPGMEFTYEYDFGSTTHLALKVVSECDGHLSAKLAQILARNDAPPILCEECGKAPATQVCTMCMYNKKAWFCDDCANEHECGEDYFLPVVNSPRVGVCGYTGAPY